MTIIIRYDRVRGRPLIALHCLLLMLVSTRRTLFTIKWQQNKNMQTTLTFSLQNIYRKLQINEGLLLWQHRPTLAYYVIYQSLGTGRQNSLFI